MNRKLEDKHKRDIIIWGTGLSSVRLTNKLKNHLVIKCYIDNKGDDGVFMGKPVHRFSEIVDHKKYYFFFAGLLSTYENVIRPQLFQLGLVEFRDFMHADWYDRQMILLHGNCHMSALKSALESSSEFNGKYFVYPHKLLYQCAKGGGVKQ